MHDRQHNEPTLMTMLPSSLLASSTLSTMTCSPSGPFHDWGCRLYVCTASLPQSCIQQSRTAGLWAAQGASRPTIWAAVCSKSWAGLGAWRLTVQVQGPHLILLGQHITRVERDLLVDVNVSWTDHLSHSCQAITLQQVISLPWLQMTPPVS